jgi:putative DNA primase/helicase
MSSLISTEQTIKQLQLLGYKDGDRLFFRAIDKRDGAGAPKNLDSVFPSIPTTLTELNTNGQGIYIVSNGGGHKDGDVVAGLAVWYEHDDMPRDKQISLWQSLRLPVPTFQVDTGGKSIHSYWVFTEPVAIEHIPPEKEGGKGRCSGDWCDIQRDLLDYSNGDKSIKNPSRVMRLAGFKHQGTGEYAQIISESGIRYSFEELRSIIPQPEPKKRPEGKSQRKDRPSAAAKTAKKNESEEPVSLRSFITADNQTLVDMGAAEGGRNSAGAALSRDLIGCEGWLSNRGVKPIESARELFDRFTAASGLDDSESDSIWDSAIGDNPTPSCSEETLERVLELARSKCEKRHFESSLAEGLVLVTREDDGKGGFKPARHQIGNHLEAIAYVNTPEGNGSALHLEFKTIRNQVICWTMPRAFIVADTAQMLGELVGRGYSFKLSKKKDLIEYLNGLGSEIEKTYTVTESTGWTKGSFVTQSKTYGDRSLRFRDIEPSPDSLSEIVGTLEDWIKSVAFFCGGNSRLIFALGTAFAAPLLSIVNLESGGFHLIGGTSAGKTTTLKVAASVVGFKDIPHWRTTTNGLESIACAHNHTLLPLDEIGQADPKDVGAIAYMLANGQGKTRMTKALTNRKAKVWQLLFLSSGEVGMGQYIAQAGISLKGGQEVRMPDIPAVPTGSTTGVFENIHNCESSKQFAQSLEYATTQQRGTALDAFLTRLVADLASNRNLSGLLTQRMILIAGKLSEGTIDHAVSRVANRFALVQVALGLAHEYELLPFPAEQIEWAINTMFTDWLKNRDGDGSIEVKQTCKKISYLLTTQEAGERFFTLPDNDGLKPRNPLGYRKLDAAGNTEELWIYPAVFREELCKGYDPTEIAKELISRGWLYPDAKGKVTRSRMFKNKETRYYVFREWKNSGDDGDDSDDYTPNKSLEAHTDDELIVTPVVIIGDDGDDHIKGDHLSRHHRHLPKIESDDKGNPNNPYLVNDSALSSPSSPSSPAKINNPNLGTNPQIKDVEDI